MNSPLTNIVGVDGKPIAVETTNSGWHYPTASGLRARVEGFSDGIICRVAAGEDKDVVQFGIGSTTSRLCDTLYSPSLDTALLFWGDGLLIERVGEGFAVSSEGPLTVTVLSNYMRTHRKLPWFAPLDKKAFPLPPAGWCSWYYYFLDITEDEMVKNTDWLAENLKKFGCEWVQIDDGWQGRGQGFGTNRDWFVTCERDFPKGMRWMSDYIRGKGFRPGIWCIPFTQSNTDLYEKQPSLFIHRQDGGSPGELPEWNDYTWMTDDDKPFDWAGRYVIDVTGDAGKDYMRRLFAMFCDEWGYDYVKIDGQWNSGAMYRNFRRGTCDPSVEWSRAVRTGQAVMKDVMGPDRFLLNCGVGFESCGLCEGIRIGGDIETSWKGMQNAVRATLLWVYLNTIAFYTDPDVVCVREPLTLEQAKVWSVLLGITGQLLMSSDKMYELPEDRVELLRRIYPVADIHPMELYPLNTENRPSIFDLKVSRPEAGEWDVVALFNWSETEAKAFELSAKKLGLAEGGSWIVVDGSTGELLHRGDGLIKLEVPTTACRVISIWPDLGRPQFVGTNRHLTQGAVDVKSVDWDEANLRLSGVSEVVGGDPYKVKMFVPEGYVVATEGVTTRGGIAELVLVSDENKTVEWQADFRK